MVPDPEVEPEAEEVHGEVLLVGVGHVFDLHDALRDLIVDEHPDAVLVELDKRRYAALTRDEEATPRGLYGIIARFQERAAEEMGTQPGEEMLTAVEAGRRIGARVGLIDLDAQVVFTRMWKAMSIREKLRFLWAAIASVFTSTDKIVEEVEELSGDYSEMMEAFAEQFPSAKTVLIDERDEVMARRIREHSTEFGSIVAVVGDGHVEGMAGRLEDLDPQVVRLQELLERDPSGDGNRSAGFTVEFR